MARAGEKTQRLLSQRSRVQLLATTWWRHLYLVPSSGMKTEQQYTQPYTKINLKKKAKIYVIYKKYKLYGGIHL